jgi:large subunit ribosomal protein L14
LGDVILVSVRWINPRKFQNVKERKKKQFAKGSLHRALIIRSKVNFKRTTGVVMRFNENSVVLVNKNVVPLCNRVFGPIFKELCMHWPSLGCVSRCIL